MNEPTWQACVPPEKPVLAQKLRIRKMSGAFSELDGNARVLAFVNDTEELATTRVDALLVDPTDPSVREIALDPPLLIIEGMKVEVVVGPHVGEVIIERLSAEAEPTAAVAWFRSNKHYPASWYGAADVAAMKQRLDEVLRQARAEGLAPEFVQFAEAHEGATYDSYCRSCDTDDPTAGPYNAHLLTKRDDEKQTLYFAIPILCGLCAESEELIEELIEDMHAIGRCGGHDVDVCDCADCENLRAAEASHADDVESPEAQKPGGTATS